MHQALPMLLSIQLLFEWFRTGPTAIHDCAQERNDTASQLLHAHHIRQTGNPGSDRMQQMLVYFLLSSGNSAIQSCQALSLLFHKFEFQCELACKQVGYVSSSRVKTHQSLQFPLTTKHMNPQTTIPSHQCTSTIPSHQCTQLGITGINGHQVEEVQSTFFAITNENISSPVHYSFCTSVNDTAATMHTTFHITGLAPHRNGCSQSIRRCQCF